MIACQKSFVNEDVEAEGCELRALILVMIAGLFKMFISRVKSNNELFEFF